MWISLVHKLPVVEEVRLAWLCISDLHNKASKFASLNCMFKERTVLPVTASLQYVSTLAEFSIISYQQQKLRHSMHTELDGDFLVVPTQNGSHFSQKQAKENQVKKMHCALPFSWCKSKVTQKKVITYTQCWCGQASGLGDLDTNNRICTWTKTRKHLLQ